MPRIRRSEDRRNVRGYVAFWVMPALAALVLSSCGGDAAAPSGGGESARSEEEAATSGSGSLPDSAAPGGEEEFAMSEDMPDSAGVGAEGSSGEFDQKIIKTADLGIRVDNVREVASEAQRVADDFGGSVLESRVDRGEDSVSADLVLSVPSPEFEEALDELRGLGEEVTNDAVRGEDVTEEFVDLESQERNLLAAEESLLNLYDEVENVNEALAIERELSGVRGQIETAQGRIEYLEARTASSRINLSILPVASPAETAWSPVGVASDAWNASLAVLQTLATAAISTVVFGWWFAPILLIGFVWWRRRVNASGGASHTGSG